MQTSTTLLLLVTAATAAVTATTAASAAAVPTTPVATIVPAAALAEVSSTEAATTATPAATALWLALGHCFEEVGDLLVGLGHHLGQLGSHVCILLNSEERCCQTLLACMREQRAVREGTPLTAEITQQRMAAFGCYAAVDTLHEK